MLNLNDQVSLRVYLQYVDRHFAFANCTIIFPVIGHQRAATVTKETGKTHVSNDVANILGGLVIDAALVLAVTAAAINASL
jgi:hypothetical protein